MSVPPDLVEAYLKAVYEIDAAGDSTITFHIDRRCAALDALLAEHGAQNAMFITAYNPRSRKQAAADNTDAHRALLDAVAKLDKRTLPARGRDPDGQWPAEPGLLVFDISREEGLTLARRFGQFAVVWIERAGAPALLFAERPSQKTSR
jgi:hypothetical protein